MRGACLSLRPLWWGRGGGLGVRRKSSGGNNGGERWAVAPDLSQRPGQGRPGKVSSFWLSLLDSTEKPDKIGRRSVGGGAGWGGGEANSLISLSPEDTGEADSESAVRLVSPPVWAAVRTEAELLQPSSSPFLPPCTHSAHSQWNVSERSPGARSRPGQEVSRPGAQWQREPSTLGFRRVRSPQRSLCQT